MDSNVFIEAARRYYAHDFAPSFWEGLAKHSSEGNILTIDRVAAELEKGKDELYKWFFQDFQNIHSTDHPMVMSEFGKMMSWVVSKNQFTESAKAEFASVADGWIVAYAKHSNSILVTHEEFNEFTKKKVPMPNLCREFGVQYIDTFRLIRNLNIKL